MAREKCFPCTFPTGACEKVVPIYCTVVLSGVKQAELSTGVDAGLSIRILLGLVEFKRQQF